MNEICLYWTWWMCLPMFTQSHLSPCAYAPATSPLTQEFSLCGIWIRGVSTTGAPVINAEFYASPRPAESKTLKWSPAIYVLIRPLGYFDVR